MKEWIMELCPEIAEWQADLIAEQAQKEVAAEREACAKLVDLECALLGKELQSAASIRARGDKL